MILSVHKLDYQLFINNFTFLFVIGICRCSSCSLDIFGRQLTEVSNFHFDCPSLCPLYYCFSNLDIASISYPKPVEDSCLHVNLWD